MSDELTPYNRNRVSDSVNHPAHYTSDAGDAWEHFRVVRAWKLSYCIGCATKYLKRYGLKDSADPIEDLRKSIKYIEMEIENIQWERDRQK